MEKSPYKKESKSKSVNSSKKCLLSSKFLKLFRSCLILFCYSLANFPVEWSNNHEWDFCFQC